MKFLTPSSPASPRIFPAALLLAAATLASTSVASAATLCVNPAGTAGCQSTISAAVALAAPGDVIQIAQGTYAEQVTITKSLSLVATPGLPASRPVIDATGKSNGIFIDGMATLPLPGVANVVISGLAIKGANFEGILVANASNVTLVENLVYQNNKALNVSAQTCPGIPAFETSEQSDCGEGIHLMATDHASVFRNIVEQNSGGILMTDETGPNTGNLINGNTVLQNPYACGITMASHPAGNLAGPTGGLPYGVTHNVISDNDSEHNGLGLPGAGAGVGIFAPFPGTTAAANVVIANQLHDNGLPGVTIHNHASAPAPAPGINLNDNLILDNHIYSNAADTADAHTGGPTGINIYSTAPITGMVIANNQFHDEALDIGFKAPAGSIEVHFNDFEENGISIANRGDASIDATENWWNCATGPSLTCSYPLGAASRLVVVPFLTAPYNPGDL